MQSTHGYPPLPPRATPQDNSYPTTPNAVVGLNSYPSPPQHHNHHQYPYHTNPGAALPFPSYQTSPYQQPNAADYPYLIGPPTFGSPHHFGSPHPNQYTQQGYSQYSAFDPEGLNQSGTGVPSTGTLYSEGNSPAVHPPFQDRYPGQLAAPSHPAGLETHQYNQATSDRTVPPLRLKLRVPPPVPPPPNLIHSSMSRRDSRSSLPSTSIGNGSNENLISNSGRPLRGARLQSQPKYYDDDDDDDDYVEHLPPPQPTSISRQPKAEQGAYMPIQAGFGSAFESGIPIEQEEIITVKEELPATKSGRHVKPPERYTGPSEIEDKLMETSSAGYRSSPVVTRRKSRRIVDPDDQDGEGDENEYAPPRNAFPPRRNRDSGNSQSFTNQSVDRRTSLNSNGNVNGARRSGVPPKITVTHSRPTRSTRSSAKKPNSDDEEDFQPSNEDLASATDASTDPIEVDYIEEDEEDDALESENSYGRPIRTRQSQSQAQRQRASSSRNTRSNATRRSARVAAKPADSDDDFGGRGGRARRRSGAFDEPITKRLRERASKVDYTMPGQLDEAELRASAIAAVSRPRGALGGLGVNARSIGGIGMRGGIKPMPWSAKGNELAKAMGDDTSDSDDFASPMKPSAGGSGGQAAIGGARPGGTDVPNFGRINPKSSMADADPLGVDMNVTFDNVGGLDGHINQLKEMVALPLLYPEVFQQFGVTPPRGVLFHGPPGTGKTLLARALAASCSTGNTKIAFFMRKGADVLSKWVGEAERQLRMLFEEARASQPSIIFFDEIDGLAPVRSSKQDQIHASLVSTLLALMDGMDGRGQVIVIGATNRPDAVDPALRRPGRFDREFYFPLPNRDARKKIIGINTRKWDPPLEEPVLEQLAGLTKGYGGADLRALCTEAALNAIQRRYPQIYRSTDRLQLDTASIHVQPKDFMISIKKIVPSSARSASSSAIPLPTQLVPLLSTPLEKLKKAVDSVLPPSKARTALEEAEFEDEDGDSFEKEMMLQSLDKLRTYRPRIIVYGDSGMGQAYIGPAILHHLEGFHVQNFDLATLMSDSTRTPESTIVQLFVEAKRHQPSILFIPSLSQWVLNLSETARATVRALLDGIPPSDPIMLLAIVDGPLDVLPPDVKAWFGFAQENRIRLFAPTADERELFFSDLINTIQRPPTDFPDGVPRRKRILEVLPLATPLPPRQPTEAELQRDVEKDTQARDMLVISFISLVQEFMKKYRRVVANVKADAMVLADALAENAALNTDLPVDNTVGSNPLMTEGPKTNGHGIVGGLVPNESVPEDSLTPLPEHVIPVAIDNSAETVPTNGVTWKAHDVDIDTLHRRLTRHRYLTPADFLADIAKIEENAEKVGDPERQAKITEMAYHARYHVSGFDPKWTPEFERYSERMMAKKKERAERKEKEKTAVVPGDDGAEGVDGLIGGKRVREDEENGGERADKRAKMEMGDDIVMGENISTAAPSQDDTGTGSLAMSIPPTSSSTFPQPQPDTSVSASIAAVSQVPSSLAREATVPPPKEPSTAHPPFHLPSSPLRDLTSSLKHETDCLNVDQLEQLRAMSLDKVWRRRTDWDRTNVLQEVQEVLRRFIAEVEGGGDE